MKIMHRVLFSALALACVLSFSALSGVSANAQIFIDQMHPAEVESGDFFIVHGSFEGVETASAWVSDGQVGVPVEVIGITDHEIVCRVGTTRWPVTGSLHLLVDGELTTLESLTLEREGYDYKMFGASVRSAQETVRGGVLSVSNTSPRPEPTATIWNGSLFLGSGLTGCPTDALTYFVEIEVETVPPGTLASAAPCPDLELSFAVEKSGTAWGRSDFAYDLVDAFNQMFGNYALAMEVEGGSADGESVVSVTQTGCQIVSGAAVFYCPE